MAGRFASQPLAFAHLLDTADKTGRVLDPDRIEVIQREHRATRLAHYFDPDTVQRIVAAMADDDTCVLLTDPGALPNADTGHLRWLGRFTGSLVRARPDASC